MNQVVITGASGLLGSQLARTFRDNDYQVKAVFNQKPELINLDIEKIQCDISDENSTSALKKQIKLRSLIVHCAAITDVNLCERDRELCTAVNINGTRNVCDLARQTESTLIFISTASVFDGIVGNYKESDKPNPANYYNKSKVEGENYVLGYERGIVIRTVPLGLHSADRKPSSFLEWLVNSFKNNLDINLFTDVKINPLSVTTLAEAITKTSTVINRGLLHLGSRDNVSKAIIGLEVKKFFPVYSGKLNLVSIDDNKNNTVNRPKEMWLNVDKALSLGFALPEALSDLNKYLVDRI